MKFKTNKLKLLGKYQRKADEKLKNELKKIETILSIPKHANIDKWSMIKNDYSAFSANTEFNNLERLIYKEIATSVVFERWLISKMNIK